MNTLIDFLNRLEAAHIYYKLNKIRDEFIMVEVAVPGQRWEIEFSDSGIEVEKFIAEGTLYDATELDVLFRDFSDRFLPAFESAALPFTFPRNLI